MSIIGKLVTDRTQADVDRLRELYAKGWENLTEDEREEWYRGDTRLFWLDGEVMACLDGELHYTNDSAANKGSYNYEDLNRVTAALEYVEGRLTEYGHSTGFVPLQIEPGRTEWQEEDIPTQGQMALYLRNVGCMRAALAVLPTTPEVPGDKEGLTCQEANDIEQILTDVETLIKSLEQIFIRCGSVWAWCGTGLYLKN